MSTVTLPWTAPPLTQNKLRRMHFQTEAKEKANALAMARWAIKMAKPEAVERAIVILHWQQPDRRKRDGDGAAPTLKVCLDALVHEHVLPDDSWAYVVHSGITCHPPSPGQPGRLWLTIHTIPQGLPNGSP